MKYSAFIIAAAIGLAAIPASTQAAGEIETVQIALKTSKFDTSIPAETRFEKLERVAERYCDSGWNDLEAKKVERACKAKLKSSVLTQVGDDALREEAKRRGVLD